jgi:hypothetical protein
MANFILSHRTIKLSRPAVVIGAKAYDVDLSHSGRKIARNPGKSKRGLMASGLALFLDGILKAIDNMNATVTKA